MEDKDRLLLVWVWFRVAVSFLVGRSEVGCYEPFKFCVDFVCLVMSMWTWRGYGVYCLMTFSLLAIVAFEFTLSSCASRMVDETHVYWYDEQGAGGWRFRGVMVSYE